MATLTYVHTCEADRTNGCPIPGREIKVEDTIDRLNEFSVPEIRCKHTNAFLKLVAVDGNRDI